MQVFSLSAEKRSGLDRVLLTQLLRCSLLMVQEVLALHRYDHQQQHLLVSEYV